VTGSGNVWHRHNDKKRSLPKQKKPEKPEKKGTPVFFSGEPPE